MSNRTGALDLLLIGIDAACNHIVEPLVNTGQLPHLATLFESGAYGSLTSQIPPWTASAWPSIYTGVNPGKHGVFGFLKYNGYDWSVVDSRDIGELTMWDILAHHGKPSVVVNAPVTHPPDEFHGAIVPGYISPEDPETVPGDALDRYRATGGTYRVYPEVTHHPHDEYPGLVRMRGDVFDFLADEVEPAFGFIQFQVTDSIFHEYPDDTKLVELVYAAVDDQVGRIIDEYEPRTVAVVSDHGMGRYDAFEFRVNEYLRRGGFVETTVGESGMPAWLPILNDRLREGDPSPQDSRPGVLAQSVHFASRIGITPERVGRILRMLRIDSRVRSVLPASVKRAGREQVDFAASVAFMRTRTELGIRMNVAGREPNGNVSQEEYESIRNALIEVLSAVRTPNGSPVFDEVAPREEYFWGPYANEAVDIVTIPAGFDQFLSADLKGSVYGEPPEPWNHKLQGIIALSGDGIDADRTIPDAHVFDVAPTLLAALNIPINERMDGRILPIVESIESAEYPVPHRRTGAGENNQAIEERLEAVGYL